MSVWIDDRAVPDAEARVPVDRGLLLGDGLFETLEVRDGATRFLAAHLDRLTNSARVLGFRLPYKDDGPQAVIERALEPLWCAEERPERAVLRVTVTRTGGRGLDVDHRTTCRVLVSLARLPARAAATCSPPVTAVVVGPSSVQRGDPASGHKLTSARGAIAARAAARLAGADRGVRLFDDGTVACADAANVFAVLGGVLTTPAPPGILPGVTRGRVIDAAAGCASIGPVVERSISMLELRDGASEVFLTNSLVGVEPVTRLGGRGMPAPGPVAEAVSALVW